MKKAKKPGFSWLFILVFIILIISLSTCQEKSEEFSTIDLLSDFEFAETLEETETLDIGDPDAASVFTSGWGKPEKTGVWATSLTSEIKFFTFVPQKKQEIVFLCRPFTYPNSPPQTLEVRLNGEFVDKQELEKKERECSFILPENSLRKGKNDLTLVFGYAKSPAEMVGGKDKRSLAVRFSSIRFPAKKSYGQHVFLKNDVIYFNPLCRINYYIKLPRAAHLQFDFEAEGTKLDRIKSDLNLNVSITEEGASVEEIFNLNLSTLSQDKKTWDVDLSQHAEKIVRLSLNLNSQGDADLVDLSQVYGKLYKPQIRGAKEPSLTGKITTESPEKLEGIEKTNLIIAILDAVNPDFMSCYGFDEKTTPYIDTLAEEGIVFTKAFAQASWTLPSTVSLFTSLHPLSHKVWSRERRLDDKAFTLAEALKEKGFKTCGLSANASASSVYNLFQGIDEEIALFDWDKDRLRSRKRLKVIWAEDFVEPAREWIYRNKQEQFFMYIHFLQPHTPYNPPPSFLDEAAHTYNGPLKGKEPLMPRKLNLDELSEADIEYLIANYKGNLRYADYYLGEIVDILKDHNIFENTILVITADHGESFLEHGVFGHSHNLFDEEIRIPLILRFPKKFGLSGKKTTALVQSMDLMPTFLEVYGQEKRNQNLEGKSLWPLILGSQEWGHRCILGSLSKPFVEEETRSDMLRDGKHKIIITKKDIQFFDLEADPGEMNNIYLQSPIISNYYNQQLLKMRKELLEGEDLAMKGKFIINKKTREHLRALGYIK